MIDLKCKKKKKDDDAPDVAPSGPESEYPYGFRLSLRSDQIDQLKMGSMNVGDDVVVTGVGKIVSSSEYDTEDESERNMEIQIQKVNIVSSDAANKMLRKEMASEVWG